MNALDRNCPMCGSEPLSGEQCHASCPLARGCSMIRCGACSYEYPDPERSLVARLAGRLFGISKGAVRGTQAQ